MEKTKLISQIIDLYDENTLLKNKLLYNETTKKQPIVELNKSGREKSDEILISIGKKHLLDRCLYSWPQVNVSRKDGEIKTTDYKDWINNKINNLPEEISAKEFKECLHNELFEIYEKEVSKKINEFKEKEKEETENSHE